jgi:hypothetical protein
MEDSLTAIASTQEGPGMEGRIIAVLETWPLQLTVEGAAGRWSVALSADTVVMDGTRPVEPSRLRQGERIAVTGKETGPLAMIAERIDLLP